MFGMFEDHHQQVYGDQHEGKFSHELIAGAASFEAARVFENRQRSEGKPVNHALAKEMIAGIAGGEVDKLFETKGLNYLDRDEARRQAQQQSGQAYDNWAQNQGGDSYNPNGPGFF
jgi:hypothetical protein